MATDVPKVVKAPKRINRDGADLPKTKSEWVDYVKKLHRQGVQERHRFELQWVTNLAFYLGHHELIFHPGSGSIEVPIAATIPLTVNRLGSFVESRHAKLTKNKPIPRVIPNTVDVPDKRAAKWSDHALLHLWRKINMDDEWDRLIMLVLQCGTAFVKTAWDPLAGDVVLDMLTPDGKIDIDETGLLKEQEIFMGEVSSKALSPFAILVASDQVRELKEQDWIMERTHASVSDVERVYPHLRGKIQFEGRDEQRTQFERTVQRLNSPIFHTHGTEESRGMDSLNQEVLVKTLYIRPNWQFPKGVICVVQGDNLALLDTFPNDYGDNVYPLVKFQEKNDGFNFWQQATVERLIPIQKAINRLKQQRATNAALMANAKWLLAKGSGVSEESLTDEEGEVIEYNPASPAPKQSEIFPMPNYVTQFDEELVADLRDVSGQRESSVSPSPGITAAVALQTQAELSDEIIGPILRRQAKGLEKVAQQQLLLMNEEYLEKRKIKIFGEQGVTAVQFLNGADLRNHTDVHIEVESMFPEFRGQKQQRLLDLWDRRIIQDPKKILRAFRYGTFDEFVDEEERLMEPIHFDIQRIKAGKEPEIHAAQNHIQYVVELAKFIQTPEYSQLIPERKQLANDTLQAHLQFIGGEPQPQQNQAAVGTPFGPATPAGAPGGGR